MRYLIVLPICLFLVSGAVWLISQRSAPTAVFANVEPTAGEREDGNRVNRAAKTAPAQASTMLTPIVIHGCTLAPIQEHNVASSIEGVITDIHVALGTMVDKGHCLAQLDDEKLRLQVELLAIKAKSVSNEKIALAMYEDAQAKVVFGEKANATGLTSVPELEMKNYIAQRDRYAYEIKKAQEDREEAKKELEKAQAHLEMHKIRSALQGEVIKVFKKPGETVKPGESLFAVARMNRLRIEGFCKAQDVSRLRAGQAILVEPELQGPQAGQLIGHTAAVNHLAISSDGKILASASDDNTAMLWSWPEGVRLATLPHPGPVHAIDVIGVKNGAETRYVVVTGGEDRQVRVWRCTADGKVDEPILIQGHEGIIRSIAIDPDGANCVSGGDDRKIGIWDLASGNHIGWVFSLGGYRQFAHQGTVTSLDFAGRGVLVSAGSDNQLKVWDIANGKSQLLKTYRGRTGDVTRLGLGGDEGQILFDHGDEIRVLDRDGGAIRGVLNNTKHTRFEGFACFSPSNALILTAAGDGRLQLWKTPAGPEERAKLDKAFKANPKLAPQLGGFEISQYQLPKAAQARCGVFAPDESVFFTGGTHRTIQAWSIPARSEWQGRTAVLTYVGSTVEPGTDLVRIQAEMDNPADHSRWWLPGTFVNLKVFP